MILKNKNILITGGGKGIGYSCIEEFLNEGAYVYAIIKSKKDFKILKNLRIKILSYIWGTSAMKSFSIKFFRIQKK